MADYVAQSSAEPRLKAWLWSTDEDESALDPLIPRKHGWRLTIAEIDGEPVRITWLETLAECLAQMDYYWPEVPIWRRDDTGDVVDLHALVGHQWQKLDAYP
jgi:hypothetical protein